jgi:LysM repeat protein
MQYVAGCQNYVSIHKGGQRSKHGARVSSTTAKASAGSKSLKYAFVILISMLLFSGFAIVQSVASVTSPEPASLVETTMIVSSGDTLWEIAAEYAAEGSDIRKMVYSIKKRNNLTGSSLQAGQLLIIPAN